jgi:predicted transcriptional regulator
MVSVCDTLSAISNDKSLVLFNTIALASGNTDILISRLRLTRKQYYSRMSELINAGLVIRRSGKYFLTSFGKVVFEAQMLIGKGIEKYWKLKAIDSIEIPAEEYNRIIDTLIGDNDMKDILLGHNTQEMIVSPAKVPSW